MKAFGKLLAPALAMAMCGGTASAMVVTDYSNFTESGSLLGTAHTRDQSFTATGASVLIADEGVAAGGSVGQELYLSDEFAQLVAGDRISLDWDGTDTATGAETFGIAIASSDAITSRVNLVTWSWRPGSDDLSITAFDAEGDNSPTQQFSWGASAPDTIYVDRTATGWEFGYIEGGVETVVVPDTTTVGTIDITADGNAVGLWSDIRTDGHTRTVSNLTIVPEPGSLALLGLGGLLVVRRRRA